MMRAVLALAILLGILHTAHALAAGAEAGPPPEQAPVASENTRININTADPKELVRLPGIGPTRAQAIVTAREKRRFRRIEDILRVPGIGRKTFGRIRNSIRVR
ncbi:MAG: ComEA family DNA-binding protein [Myxococcales bacterium]|nr:ComEA family DNA-binding protein [Myxococcales bacterium]MDH3485613.1 ComEA family DNA-binding protein [Myxococcales bacterium]